MVKNLPANAGDARDVGLGQEDALEEGMATHSSILVWRIPWTEEPGWAMFHMIAESDVIEVTACMLGFCGRGRHIGWSTEEEKEEEMKEERK